MKLFRKISDSPNLIQDSSESEFRILKLDPNIYTSLSTVFLLSIAIKSLQNHSNLENKSCISTCLYSKDRYVSFRYSLKLFPFVNTVVVSEDRAVFMLLTVVQVPSDGSYNSALFREPSRPLNPPVNNTFPFVNMVVV